MGLEEIHHQDPLREIPGGQTGSGREVTKKDTEPPFELTEPKIEKKHKSENVMVSLQDDINKYKTSKHGTRDTPRRAEEKLEGWLKDIPETEEEWDELKTKFPEDYSKVQKRFLRIYEGVKKTLSSKNEFVKKKSYISKTWTSLIDKIVNHETSPKTGSLSFFSNIGKNKVINKMRSKLAKLPPNKELSRQELLAFHYVDKNTPEKEKKIEGYDNFKGQVDNNRNMINEHEKAVKKLGTEKKFMQIQEKNK